MDKKIISTAGFFGITAIILGAFGAHALKKILNIEQLNTFETGVRYQMYHAFFLLFLSLFTHLKEKTKQLILVFTIVGIIFFSGSIYLLATTPLTGIDFKNLGVFTPIGGIFLIVSWGILIFNSMNKK